MNDMQNLLLLCSSKAEFDCYQNIYEGFENHNRVLLLDITDLGAYSVNYKNNKYDFIKFNGYYRSKRSFHRIINLISFHYFFNSICKKNEINHVVMGGEKEPVNLIIINYCRRNQIRTTIFQHGLYSADTETYESEIYKQRFNRLSLKFYRYFRRFLASVGILQGRKPIGQNGASQYYFYSKYYYDLFVTKENESKLRIVGPTKYASLKTIPFNAKSNVIVYASCLMKKWYPQFGIDDGELFEKFASIIPDNYEFIIKPHPSEKKIEYEKALKNVSFNFTLLDPSDSLEGYFFNAKMLFTFTSSVIYDAIFFNSIVVIIDFNEGKYLGDLKGLYNIQYKALKNINIFNMISEVAISSTLLDKQKALFHKHLGMDLEENPAKFVSYLK